MHIGTTDSGWLILRADRPDWATGDEPAPDPVERLLSAPELVRSEALARSEVIRLSALRPELGPTYFAKPTRVDPACWTQRAGLVAVVGISALVDARQVREEEVVVDRVTPGIEFAAPPPASAGIVWGQLWTRIRKRES